MSLLPIIDDHAFGDEYLDIAKKCAEKCSILWYRIKNKNAAEIISKAKKLRDSLLHTKLIISERFDIANLCGFDGVHLNNKSLPPSVVRQTNPDMIIGYSAHSYEECFDENCDYFTLSPIFYTEKDYEVRPLGLRKTPTANIYALGGMSLKDYEPCKKLGFKGIAGINLCMQIIENR